MPNRSFRVLLLAALAVVAVGCAARRVRPAATPALAEKEHAKEVPASSPGVPNARVASSVASPEPAAGASATPPDKPSLRDLCRVRSDSDAVVDEARRRLQETVCGANLWLDGLFGGKPDVKNARAVSGNLEGSGLYTQAEGADFKMRLRLKYDLPNLEHRVNFFLGRVDDREAIEDRYEGLSIRSVLFSQEDRLEWLGGLGYSPPGNWAKRLDFRVGVRLKTASEVYFQGRYLRNFFFGQKSVVRLRETIFWENREDGFGGTTSLDVDHVVSPTRLLRFTNVATLSEGTEGTRWRSALLLYQNLSHSRAIVYQTFVRGETAAEVPLREYGVQGVFRMPFGRPWLFANVSGGYTWPRFEREDRRQGSALVGFGIELQFGENPY